MSEPKFSITTVMEQEDYRKFLYLATFRRNPMVLPLVALIALLGSWAVNWSMEGLKLLPLLLTWVGMFALAIGTLCWKVERKNKQRVATDKTGTFGAKNLLKFYDDRLVMEQEAMHSKGELRYEQFYQLLETKDYFIFYLSMNQASLLRKKDVADVGSLQEFLRSKLEGRYRSIK